MDSLLACAICQEDEHGHVSFHVRSATLTAGAVRRYPPTLLKDWRGPTKRHVVAACP